MPKTLYKPTPTPTNLQLVYYFHTMQYYPNPLQKLHSFIYYYKYNPFTPNDYFPLTIPPNTTRLLYLLAILAYPVPRQRHTSLPILQRRHRKNRDSIRHFAQRLFSSTIRYTYILIALLYLLFSKTR